MARFSKALVAAIALASSTFLSAKFAHADSFNQFKILGTGSISTSIGSPAVGSTTVIRDVSAASVSINGGLAQALNLVLSSGTDPNPIATTCLALAAQLEERRVTATALGKTPTGSLLISGAYFKNGSVVTFSSITDCALL